MKQRLHPIKLNIWHLSYRLGVDGKSICERIGEGMLLPIRTDHVLSFTDTHITEDESVKTDKWHHISTGEITLFDFTRDIRIRGIFSNRSNFRMESTTLQEKCRMHSLVPVDLSTIPKMILSDLLGAIPASEASSVE